MENKPAFTMTAGRRVPARPFDEGSPSAESVRYSSRENTGRLGTTYGYGGGMLGSPTASDDLRARLEAARRLGALGADARDLTELFHALYDETSRVVDATVFLFALYDEASETVEVVRQVDRGVEHEGGSFPLGKGFTSEVIRTGLPKVIRRWATEGPSVRLLYGTEAGELVSPQSGLVVPIRSADRVLGVISVQSYRPDAYQDADVLGLEGITSHNAGQHDHRYDETVKVKALGVSLVEERSATGYKRESRGYTARRPP